MQIIWLCSILFLFFSAAAKVTDVESIVDDYGYQRFRPFGCCSACGSSFRYFNGRCYNDIGGTVAVKKNENGGDAPYFTGPEQCCFFCGAAEDSFVYDYDSKSCIQKSKSEPSINGIKCHICKFLIMGYLIQNLELPSLRHEVDYQCRGTGVFQKDCEEMFSSKFDSLISTLRNNQTAEYACGEQGWCPPIQAVRRKVNNPKIIRLKQL